MKIWRLHKAHYRANNATGARLVGGRYNSPGVEALYCSPSAAATILELRVHLTVIPAASERFSISFCEIDENLLATFQSKDIPGWDDWPNLSRPQAFGDSLLNRTDQLGFVAPSLSTQGYDSTVILNPRHSAYAQLQWTSSEFVFDPRLWA